MILATACAATGQEQGPVMPGDPQVAGAELAAYSARWQSQVSQNGEWVAQPGFLTEEMTLEGDRWVRIQVTDQGPWGTVTRVEMDRNTLRPLLLRRSLLDKTPDMVIEQLKAAGFVNEFEMRFEGRQLEIRKTDFDGQTSVEARDLGAAFFDGSVLGLIVAALPLEEGASARVPILFVDGRAGDITQYWVDTRVVGKEEVNGSEAVRVDVAWLDFETEAMSSEPGPDAAGGAYWITEEAGGDVPPVPRYRNESFDIVVTPAPSGS